MNSNQRLEALCRAYEIKIALLMQIIELYRGGYDRMAAELERP